MLRSIIYTLAFTLFLAPNSIKAFAQANDPAGSRYEAWEQGQMWLNHYGSDTDRGWVSTKYVRTFGDVNGDGLQDVVAFGKPNVFVGLSNGRSFTDSGRWSEDFTTNRNWLVGKHPRFVIDMNKDGKDDLVGFGGGGVWVGLSTGTAFQPKTRWIADFGANSASWPAPTTERYIADVNGDKYPDIVGFGLDGTYVALNQPGQNKFSAKEKWLNNFGHNNNWEDKDFVRTVGDMNGDGRADLVGFGTQGTFIALAQDGKFGPAAIVTEEFGTNKGWTVAAHGRFLADVNNDKMLDIVGFGAREIFIGYSTGVATSNSWTVKKQTGQFTTANNWVPADDERFVTDMNGDGKADIVAFTDDGMSVALATGQGSDIVYSTAEQWVNDFGPDQGWRTGIHPRFLVDVNGDGRPDPAGYGNDGVKVSPSAGLYCCDKISFLDSGNGNQRVNGAWIARAYLPRSLIVMNKRGKPDTCNANASYHDPLRPIGDNKGNGFPPWSTEYQARLMINANFFQLFRKLKLHEASGTCTNIRGWAISEGQTLTAYSKVHGKDTQTMAFIHEVKQLGKGSPIRAEIFENAKIQQYRDAIGYAVSGFKLVDNGTYVPQPGEIKPKLNRARTAIGLTKDSKTIIIVVVNNGANKGPYPDGGVTLPGLANLLIKLGARNALTLDGSGSAQFHFDNGTKPYISEGSDSYAGEKHLYRRVPLFFGIK